MIRLKLRPRPGMVCRQAVELVMDYVDGALSSAQRLRFERHLTACLDCPEYLAQTRAVITLAGSITPDDLTPRMRSELTGLYRRWLSDKS